MAARRAWWCWVAGFAVVAAMLAAGTLLFERRTDRFAVRPVAEVLPADGREREVMRVVRLGGGAVPAGEVAVEAIAGQSGDDGGDARLIEGSAVEIWMRAPVMAGERRVRVRWGRRLVTEAVRFAESDADSFGDGMPDALRLHTAEDRVAFRQWFWRLADLQAELPERERAEEIQDCAALLRYGYREALKVHDAEWARAQHAGDVAFASVRQWKYPETMLGAGLFRVRPGPFEAGDESNGTFLQFADAHALMSWNAYRLGRDVRAARPGDLIFYRQLGENSPYHSMVITGSDAGWVVYHTGPIKGHRGELRRMALADLLRHPDARWRPVAENSNFLGVYRWNLLREGE